MSVWLDRCGHYRNNQTNLFLFSYHWVTSFYINFHVTFLLSLSACHLNQVDLLTDLKQKPFILQGIIIKVIFAVSVFTFFIMKYMLWFIQTSAGKSLSFSIPLLICGAIFTPPRNRGGVIFLLQFVCLCVCVCVCPFVKKMPIEPLHRFWRGLR